MENSIVAQTSFLVFFLRVGDGERDDVGPPSFDDKSSRLQFGHIDRHSLCLSSGHLCNNKKFISEETVTHKGRLRRQMPLKHCLRLY